MKESSRGSQGLPEIPDYPDSPLPPWIHYGITAFAGKQIQMELDRLGYTGYLIGLSVGYSLDGEDAPSYAMEFGRVPPLDVAQEPEPKNPLSDEFVLELHDQVSVLVHQYTPEEFGDMNVTLSANVSGSEYTVVVVCRFVQAGECSQNPPHTDKRKCLKRQDGGWKCLHASCG